MDDIMMVVPTIPKDVGKFFENLDTYFELLPIRGICIIGDSSIKKMMPNDNRVSYVNENDIVEFNRVKDLIVSRTGDVDTGKRAGWYVQQFVKLGYSRICDEEYYLLWDSDTIPVKKISLMTDDERPFFDYKTEYHKPYFDTIEKLFPGLKKQIKGSFIAEHMLIKTTFMREMIDSIEKNQSLIGNDYVEKVINAINIDDLPKSGFSEFETYGSFVISKYKSAYLLRKWKSLRFGGFFFDGASKIQDRDLLWIAKRYDAISFEKGDYLSFFSKIIPLIEKILPVTFLEVVAFCIRCYRKVMRKR